MLSAATMFVTASAAVSTASKMIKMVKMAYLSESVKRALLFHHVVPILADLCVLDGCKNVPKLKKLYKVARI